jgi:hypothetical protein
MHKPAILAIAAAAALVVAVFGVGLLSRQGGVGAVSPPPPSSVATPLAYTWPGPLAAGTYTTDFAFDLPFAVTFTVPHGWEARDVSVEKPGRLSAMVLAVDNVFTDACFGTDQEPAIGGGADQLVSALANMRWLDVRSRRAATLAGFRGTYVEYALDRDAPCISGSSAIFHLSPLTCDQGCGGLGSRVVGIELPGEDVLTRAWVLQPGGRARLVIQAVAAPGASAAELAELEAVIDSMSIAMTDPPTPPPSPVGP